MEKSLEKDFNFDFYLKYVLAIGLLFIGISKFVPFMPVVELPPEAANLYQALDQAGYILPLVGFIEILAGALLIRKNTTPLGLLILLPFSVNLVLFHLFLAPTQILPALFVFVLNAVLIYRDRAIFSPIIHSITDGEDEVKESISKMSWVTKSLDKNRS